MITRSFFEYLGIADMERIHSQIISWIFSKDCSALNEAQKVSLLENFFSLKEVKKIEKVQTEVDRIDILIQTDEHLIVVENKIKSSEHSNQLDRYAEFCKKNYNIEPKFFYLTLIGENTKNQIWSRISYQHIFECLEDITLQKHPNSVILKEYINYLNKLVEVLVDFKSEARKYDMVFLDGKKKKSEKVGFIYNNDNEKFIADNQLETILQKCFLNALSQKIEHTTSHVNDTRGDALIDFHLKHDIVYNKKKYSTTLQLQGNIIKFCFSVYGVGYGTSKKEWVDDVLPMMDIISKSNPFGYTKRNSPKTKAFVSISKRLSKQYWHMEIDELIGFIEEEINNGHELTKMLEVQLTKFNIKGQSSS